MPPGWWKCYPERGTGRRPRVSGPDDEPDPRFPVGATVRLIDKPTQVRKILKVEWHSIHREYSYIVETSTGNRFCPYWFAAQLVLVVQITQREPP
jgi:hypothetical protein